GTEFIEAGGYPLYPATQTWLEDIDLLKMPVKSLHHAFVINNAAQPPSKKLQQALSAQGVTVTQENLSGLERMMKQSESTEVPVDNVTAILDWLNNRSEEHTSEL